MFVFLIPSMRFSHFFEGNNTHFLKNHSSNVFVINVFIDNNIKIKIYKDLKIKIKVTYLYITIYIRWPD
jgi:hypothetical protein